MVQIYSRHPQERPKASTHPNRIVVPFFFAMIFQLTSSRRLQDSVSIRLE
jgi:hypothetical protein